MSYYILTKDIRQEFLQTLLKKYGIKETDVQFLGCFK